MRRITTKILIILLTRLSKLFDDVTYVRLMYFLVFKSKINLNNPERFNEKLNWLKLNNRNPIFTKMADKYLVKSYVADIIGSEYIVPCYGYWSHIKDIEFDKLPDRFFLKSTHDSGGGILVDKTIGVDYKVIRRRFSGRVLKRRNWYWHLREWPYKDIQPAVIAEEYLDEGTGRELHDYKFYCFDGVPMYMYITNKGKCIRENFYDMDFRPVDISHNYERTTPEYNKPENFDKMKELAARLSQGHPFIRIDFFNVSGKLYFGEFTFYDWGGMKPLNDKWEVKLGKLINLDLLNKHA